MSRDGGIRLGGGSMLLRQLFHGLLLLLRQRVDKLLLQVVVVLIRPVFRFGTCPVLHLVCDPNDGED